MGTKLVLGLVAGAMVFAFACSKSDEGTTAATVISYEGPITSTDIQTGAEVYATFCEGCHPGGQEGDGPKIAGIAWSAPAMRKQVREGSDDMPGFGPDKINPDELEALLAFSVTIDATSAQ